MNHQLLISAPPALVRRVLVSAAVSSQRDAVALQSYHVEVAVNRLPDNAVPRYVVERLLRSNLFGNDFEPRGRLTPSATSIVRLAAKQWIAIACIAHARDHMHAAAILERSSLAGAGGGFIEPPLTWTVV